LTGYTALGTVLALFKVGATLLCAYGSFEFYTVTPHNILLSK